MINLTSTWSIYYQQSMIILALISYIDYVPFFNIVICTLCRMLTCLYSKKKKCVCNVPILHLNFFLCLRWKKNSPNFVLINKLDIITWNLSYSTKFYRGTIITFLCILPNNTDKKFVSHHHMHFSEMDRVITMY